VTSRTSSSGDTDPRPQSTPRGRGRKRDRDQRADPASAHGDPLGFMPPSNPTRPAESSTKLAPTWNPIAEPRWRHAPRAESPDGERAAPRSRSPPRYAKTSSVHRGETNNVLWRSPVPPSAGHGPEDAGDERAGGERGTTWYAPASPQRKPCALVRSDREEHPTVPDRRRFQGPQCGRLRTNRQAEDSRTTDSVACRRSGTEDLQPRSASPGLNVRKKTWGW